MDLNSLIEELNDTLDFMKTGFIKSNMDTLVDSIQKTIDFLEEVNRLLAK